MGKLLFFTFFFVLCTVGFSQIVIDGDLSDWTPAMQIDVLPGVVEETDDYALEKLDIKDVYITNDADSIYFRIDINENGLLSDLESDPVGQISIFLDADIDVETGLTWGWWALGGDFWMTLTNPEDTILAFIGESGSDSRWKNTGFPYHVVYNDDDNAMEVAIPRAAIAMDDAPVVGLRLLVLAENTVDWSSDAYPSSFSVDIAAYHYNASITVDGELADWTTAMQFDVEPNPIEDVDDFTPEKLDLRDVYVAHDLDSIYFRIDINENGLLSDLGSDPIGQMSMFFDTDMDVETGLTWGWWALGGDYWITFTNPEDTILVFTGEHGSDSQWETTGDVYTVAYNADDNVVEIGIARASLGEVDNFYESLRFLVLAENTVDWSNDAYPSSFSVDIAPYYFSSFPPADTTTGIVEQDTYIPESANLLRNYPNPFNPSTTISFVLENADKITLEIFNLLGQKVRTLYSGNASRGTNNIMWDGKDDLSRPVKSGVYLYTLTTTNTSMSNKLILLK